MYRFDRKLLSKHTAYERAKFPQGGIKKDLVTFCVISYNVLSSLYFIAFISL